MFHIFRFNWVDHIGLFVFCLFFEFQVSLFFLHWIKLFCLLYKTHLEFTVSKIIISSVICFIVLASCNAVVVKSYMFFYKHFWLFDSKVVSSISYIVILQFE